VCDRPVLPNDHICPAQKPPLLCGPAYPADRVFFFGPDFVALSFQLFHPAGFIHRIKFISPPEIAVITDEPKSGIFLRPTGFPGQ